MKYAKKTFDFELTSVTKSAKSEECIIEGYANTSSKDRVGDVVIPNAFVKSLPTYLNNPVLLLNHDWTDVAGMVQEAKVTDKGLYIRARISDTREDLKTLVREKCLRTFSIGYNEIDADIDISTKTKYIKELELLEISVVSVPANTEAMFVQIAGKPQEEGTPMGEIESKGGPGSGRRPGGGAGKPTSAAPSSTPKPAAEPKKLTASPRASAEQKAKVRDENRRRTLEKNREAVVAYSKRSERAKAGIQAAKARRAASEAASADTTRRREEARSGKALVQKEMGSVLSDDVMDSLANLLSSGELNDDTILSFAKEQGLTEEQVFEGVAELVDILERTAENPNAIIESIPAEALEGQGNESEEVKSMDNIELKEAGNLNEPSLTEGAATAPVLEDNTVELLKQLMAKVDMLAQGMTLCLDKMKAMEEKETMEAVEEQLEESSEEETAEEPKEEGAEVSEEAPSDEVPADAVPAEEVPAEETPEAAAPGAEDKEDQMDDSEEESMMTPEAPASEEDMEEDEEDKDKKEEDEAALKSLEITDEELDLEIKYLFQQIQQLEDSENS